MKCNTTSSVFKKVSLFVAAVCISVFGFANEPEAAHNEGGEHATEEHSTEKKEFNPTETIMHHIADSHEFHVYGEGHEGEHR